MSNGRATVTLRNEDQVNIDSYELLPAGVLRAESRAPESPFGTEVVVTYYSPHNWLSITEKETRRKTPQPPAVNTGAASAQRL